MLIETDRRQPDTAKSRRRARVAVSKLMRTLLPLIWAFLFIPAFAVEVYRDTDDTGPVKFSDTPFPGSEVYQVPSLPTYTPAKTHDMFADETEPQIDSGYSGYEALTIANIHNGEAVRANDGDVTVKLALQPTLKAAAGHRFMVLLDNRERKLSATPTVQFVELDRGQHTLQAMVVNARGEKLIHSERVKFFVKRVSVLVP